MKEHLVLMSGYGAPEAEDIALYALAGGRAEKRFGMRHGRAPSFCCKGENGLIYAASERPDGAHVTAYALRGDGLCAVGALDVPGSGLCHLYAHGGAVFGCCFESGHYFAVDAGLTRVLWQFCPDNARAHWAQAAMDGLYLADLGNDCVYRFSLKSGLPTGNPDVLRQRAGSGPRQILPLGDDLLLCANELDGMLRVLDAGGAALTACPASGEKQPRNWPGGVCRDEGGRLYACNRGPNTLAAFERRGQRLVPLWEQPTGDWPRHAAAVPGASLVLAACTRGNAVYGYDVGGDAPREAFCLPLAGASCVLPL